MSGKIITLAQQKGGSGKTTLAAHLAVAAARKNGKVVALLDVDPQGSLGEWLEAREQTLGRADTGLKFQTASGWGARREARALADDYDIVVVDTPPKSDSESRPAIEAAQIVVVPVQPSPVDLWASELTLDLAEKERVPALMVLNRVPPRATLTQEMADALARFDAELAETRLGNRVGFAAAMKDGRTVTEVDPRGKAAGEVDALMKELFRTIGV